MKIEYETSLTKEARQAIVGAWSRFDTIADNMGRGDALAQALNNERCQRSCLTSAMGGLLECALGPAPDFIKLIRMSEGCRFAAILGAAMREECFDEWLAVEDQIRLAVDHHRRVIDSMVEAAAKA